MSTASTVLVALIAVLHTYFLALEMFLWQTPYGRRVFGNTVEKAELTAVLAKNQGLYNGFLVAGLVWSLVASPLEAYHLRIFFSACVAVAGAYGGVTVSPKIFFVQGVPGLLALGATLAANA
jgi:putative membrane protein